MIALKDPVGRRSCDRDAGCGGSIGCCDIVVVGITLVDLEESEAPDDVLIRLSANFELCVYGLSEVRRQWERERKHTSLRQ